MNKKKIIFLINPISGSKSKTAIPFIIDKEIDKNIYAPQVIFTDYAGQATEIAAMAAANQVHAIVAVGGDGTVNEIAKALLGTKVAIGIVPAGSGNGLARHLKIPMDPVKAIASINHSKEIRIDAGLINDRYFFCTAGVGFDAHIGYMFSYKTHRGFQGYLTTSIREYFKYIPQTYKITCNGTTMERKAFLVTFANASQYGNNAYIAPQANLHDGLLDICMMKGLNPFTGAMVGWRIFAGNLHKSSLVEYVKTKELVLERSNAGSIHLDGEPVQMGTKLVVKSIPSCLSVLVPK